MIARVSLGGRRVVALCGGIGGAKLALGLAHLVGQDLALIVNTADDFEHLGLAISPDIDTVLYTLSDRADRERGWGRADESWNFMASLGELGAESWFQLGDRDLALHVVRTHQLRNGLSLTAIVREFAGRFGIRATILPMSDDRVRTIIDTSEGRLTFQRYFVERRCAPEVRSIHFDGVREATLPPPVRAALQATALRAIVVCPSNPFLSIDPILAMPGIRSLVETAGAPVVAVSPIIGGVAVKGPTTKIMAELGVPATPRAIADHYRGLIDGLIIDESDAGERNLSGVAVKVACTLMRSTADRERLAFDVLTFADEIASRKAITP